MHAYEPGVLWAGQLFVLKQPAPHQKTDRVCVNQKSSGKNLNAIAQNC
jgi:hypothetical protein